MRTFFLLVGRELAAVFYSVWTYILLAAVAALTAWWFQEALLHANFEMSTALLTIYGWIFWLAFLLAPLLTMRLFVDEKRSGSLELLMTAPVSDTGVVLSKLAGATITFAAFLAPLWIIFGVLAFAFGAKPDWGQLSSFTLGFLLLGEVFLAFGLLASALGSTHLYAALLAMLGGSVLILPGSVVQLVDPESRLRRVLDYLDLEGQLRTAAVGLIDVRHVVLQATLSALFVFWTIRVVEARRWL